MTIHCEAPPFPPFLPANATVMMMGTLPPTPEKWAMSFYYPNWQNDMWRIYGLAFFADSEYFQVPDEKRFDPEKIRAFLRERGIALCSTVGKAVREKGNASDKFLRITQAVDLENILPQVTKVKFLLTTGGLATQTLLSLLPEPPALPKTNESVNFSYGERALTLYRLPSSSRAYPLSLAKKATAYRRFFQTAGLITDAS